MSAAWHPRGVDYPARGLKFESAGKRHSLKAGDGGPALPAFKK
jgi:hypothetical protein